MLWITFFICLHVVKCLGGDGATHWVTNKDNGLTGILCRNMLDDLDCIFNKICLTHHSLIISEVCTVSPEIKCYNSRLCLRYLREGSEALGGVTSSVEADKHVAYRTCIVNWSFVKYFDWIEKLIPRRWIVLCVCSCGLFNDGRLATLTMLSKRFLFLWHLNISWRILMLVKNTNSIRGI